MVRGFAAYVFLYAPLAIVVLYSFNDSRLNAQWVGFTLAWYEKLLHNEPMLIAARNSLLIALAAAAASTCSALWPDSRCTATVLACCPARARHHRDP